MKSLLAKSFLFVLPILILFISCKSDNSSEPIYQDDLIQIDLNATWKFELAPAIDSLAGNKSVEIVEITETNGKITGNIKGNPVQGNKFGNNVIFTWMDYADETSLDDSIFLPSHVFELTVVNDLQMVGTVRNINQPGSNIFNVNADKLNFPMVMSVDGLTQNNCNASFSKYNVRYYFNIQLNGLPTSDFDYEKAGGGYYMFKRKVTSNFTNQFTVYIPLEPFQIWKASRDFTLTVEMKNASFQFTPSPNIPSTLRSQLASVGYDKIDEYWKAILDFHSKWPEFAFSFAYNFYTTNYALYVNVPDSPNYNHNEIKKHPVIEHLRKAFWEINGLSMGDFYLKIGEDIEDTWKLNRSCFEGTPLVLVWVTGSKSVYWH